MVDLTCVINLHNEGALAHRTIRSVERALAHARGFGIDADLLVVCDRPSPATVHLLQTQWRDANVLTVDEGDLGLARNCGVANAKGNYLAFVDGDDLISENWLTAAFHFGQENPRSIMHPEANVVFDQARRLFFHPNQPEGPFRDGTLGIDNFWSALSCAHHSIYREVPYAPHPIGSGYGYEDWYFNCETIAAGYRHRAVPQTAHFIRVKQSSSLCQQVTASGAVLRHNALFDQPSFYNSAVLLSGVHQ